MLLSGCDGVLSYWYMPRADTANTLVQAFFLPTFANTPEIGVEITFRGGYV
jgi:hypothetical protein